MKKKILLFLGLIVFFCLIFLAGFNLGKRSIRPEIIYKVDSGKSSLVEKRYLYFTGRASAIDMPNNAITLSNGSESVKIGIAKDTPVESYAFRPEDKTPNEQPKIFQVKDILVGDKVSIYVEVQKDGTLLGTNVYIHFVPVNAF